MGRVWIDEKYSDVVVSFDCRSERNTYVYREGLHDIQPLFVHNLKMISQGVLPALHDPE